MLRILYWAHIDFVEAQITEKLMGLPGISFEKVKSKRDFLSSAAAADGIVMPDPPEHCVDELGALLRDPCCQVRWIHIVTAGRENFVKTNPPLHISVSGPSGAHSPTVAEHALALMLSHTRQIPKFVEMTKHRVWDKSIMTYMSSLEGQTLGIIGAGHVGIEIARRAKAFGMDVICCNRTVREVPSFDRIYPLTELGELLSMSDFLVVTVAATTETFHLIGSKEFARCKPTAYFVNVARGSIVDTAALTDALHHRLIAGAGIDVTDPEPLPPDHPLWSAPNLTVSPHVSGGRSARSLERLADRVVENLNRFRVEIR